MFNTIPFPITAIYMALLGIMLVPLSVYVTVTRTKTKIMLLDGGNEQMARAIRAQGNFIEYVPLALLLMATLEWSGQPGWLMHSLGGLLLVGRLLHAYGMVSRKDIPRGLGATGTWIVVGAAGVWLLYGTAMA